MNDSTAASTFTTDRFSLPTAGGGATRLTNHRPSRGGVNDDDPCGLETETLETSTRLSAEMFTVRRKNTRMTNVSSMVGNVLRTELKIRNTLKVFKKIF